MPQTRKFQHPAQWPICQGVQVIVGIIYTSSCHTALTTKDTMSNLPPCPQCQSVYTYEDRDLYVCPECAHEWSPHAAKDDDDQGSDDVIRDANGTKLQDGDTVMVIKDLKIKGSSDVVKVGTKVKGIRLVGGDHDIDCKIPGIGAMGLKSQFVKKVTD